MTCDVEHPGRTLKRNQPLEVTGGRIGPSAATNRPERSAARGGSRRIRAEQAGSEEESYREQESLHIVP
jgi:hypothetical protein